MEKLGFKTTLLSVEKINNYVNEIKKDSWLKINFENIIEKSGLPFSSLLFKLEEVQGFNLIRRYKNKYEGRCFYLDIDDNFDLNNLLS